MKGVTIFLYILVVKHDKALLQSTEGTVYCDGRDIFQTGSEYRRMLGYLPQEFGFYPEFTVQDYLLYIGALKGIRPAVARRRVKELIVKVGLTKEAATKMKKLSGGMKRRAGIAQAMLNDPGILILDEPTAGRSFFGCFCFSRSGFLPK